MELKFNATKQEKQEILHSALCNGLTHFGAYGIELSYDQNEYNAAKVSLEAQKAAGTWDNGLSAICFEDILSEMVKSGKSLVILDNENDDEEIGRINLDMLEANWDKVPQRHMLDFMNENDDAETADAFLQTIGLGEITYG